jgi:hypothetical protein
VEIGSNKKHILPVSPTLLLRSARGWLTVVFLASILRTSNGSLLADVSWKIP